MKPIPIPTKLMFLDHDRTAVFDQFDQQIAEFQVSHSDCVKMLDAMNIHWSEICTFGCPNFIAPCGPDSVANLYQKLSAEYEALKVKHEKLRQFVKELSRNINAALDHI